MKCNYLYFILLSAGFVGCAPQEKMVKSIVPKQEIKKDVEPKPVVEEKKQVEKPLVEKSHGVEFFRTNISDPAKNDNTTSYGSIVSAKTKHFKVTKTFFPAVAQNFRQKYIILHYTAIDDEKSIRVLSQGGVSSHYLINSYDDNEIYQLVDENKRAYHAGVSHWRGANNLNDTSIGIEIVNLSTNLPSGEYYFAPYPDYQIKKVAELVKDIADRYSIPPTNILAHSDVAPTRKQDPGPQFPWKMLHDQYGIGMWYDEATKYRLMNEMTNEEFLENQMSMSFASKCQELLKKFGYEATITGEWDKKTKQIVTAFQYHFRPEKYDGVMDLETYAILQALLEKYK